MVTSTESRDASERGTQDGLVVPIPQIMDVRKETEAPPSHVPRNFMPPPPPTHRISPLMQMTLSAGTASSGSSPSSFPKPTVTNNAPLTTKPNPAGLEQRASTWGHYSAPTGLSGMTPTSASPYFASSPIQTMSPVVVTTAGGNAVLASGFPFLPNLSHSSSAMSSMAPSPVSQARGAMEKAMQSERVRMKELERDEMNLSADELRAILRKERSRMTRLAGEVASLKSSAATSQMEAEVSEEGRINGLMRRLEGLQQEKGRIILELEREEEMLTNTLQKKLTEVKREKALLQQKIEKEQMAGMELKSKLTSIGGLESDLVIEGDEEEEEGDQQIEEELLGVQQLEPTL